MEKPAGQDRRPELHRENTAVCGRFETHAAPDIGCSCGFYAAKTPELLKTVYFVGASSNGLSNVDGTVLCQVELAGKIVEGERGYRAQRMRILGAVVERLCANCNRAPTAKVAIASGVCKPGEGSGDPYVDWARSLSTQADTMSGWLKAACDSCASGTQSYTLAYLRNKLGIEIDVGTVLRSRYEA